MLINAEAPFPKELAAVGRLRIRAGSRGRTLPAGRLISIISGKSICVYSLIVMFIIIFLKKYVLLTVFENPEISYHIFTKCLSMRKLLFQRSWQLWANFAHRLTEDCLFDFLTDFLKIIVDIFVSETKNIKTN